MAYAGACVCESSSLQNVKAGRVAVNRYYFKNDTFGSHLSTVTHEIVHLLGFVSGLYDKFKDSNGNSYTAGTLTFKKRLEGQTKLYSLVPLF